MLWPSKVFSRNGMMDGWFVNNIDIQFCCCRRIFATLTRYTSRISHLVKSESQYILITFYLSGSYKSCGNSYTITEAKTIELEPLMSKNYHPWDTITRPDIAWTPSANILYTLIIFDAGAYISHGVYINIEGNDIDNSEVKILSRSISQHVF